MCCHVICFHCCVELRELRRLGWFSEQSSRTLISAELAGVCPDGDVLRDCTPSHPCEEVLWPQSRCPVEVLVTGVCNGRTVQGMYHQGVSF